jgi:hypothetical protein
MHSRLTTNTFVLVTLSLAAACSSAAKTDTTQGGSTTPPAAGVPAASASVAGRVSGASGASGVGTLANAGRGNTVSTAGATAAPIGGATSTPAAGNTGASAAAGSGTGSAPDAADYFSSGAWHGYVWTLSQGAGTTVTPMDFKAQTTGMPRCVKGSVTATSDYSGNASLGFNLNETGGAKLTVTPTKAGVMLDVKNTGAAQLRFQVEGASAGANMRWCAVISGSGGFIPWASLNTACWDNTGTAYNNEPIASAAVVVAGKMDAAVAFDFCVNSLVEADGPTGGAAGSGGGPSAGGGGPGSTAGSGSSVPPIQGGCDGYATRYWDCCKPHCGWKDNAPAGANPLAACDKADNSLGGSYDAKNACEAGGTAYLCHAMVPWAVNDKVAYGYTAVAASGGDICGRCYQLQFTGVSKNAGEDPGSAALAGKSMIVQATNIGGDVGSGQFDINVPGGGVGMYNACSSQWGVPAGDLGEQYGGFLPTCKQQVGRTDHAALKSCVMQSCMNVFEAHGLTELAAGCRWFVDWFEVADNPSVKYKEVACPSELSGKGIRRTDSPGNACVR